jgi:hypothetical protein
VEHEEQGAALHELHAGIELAEQLCVFSLITFVPILGGIGTFGVRHNS